MSKIPDNYYSDFPARMSDGRFITDYTPNCQHNLAIQNNMTSWQYRVYLTRYANQIMDNVNTLNNKFYGCESCDPNVAALPKYENQCTSQGCNISQVNPSGVGLK